MKTVQKVAGLVVVMVTLFGTVMMVGARTAHAQSGVSTAAIPLDISPTVPLSERVEFAAVHLKGVPAQRHQFHYGTHSAEFLYHNGVPLDGAG